MIVLGINFYFEHPSVCILIDGRLVFFAEEERFNRIKGGKRYSPYSTKIPFNALYKALVYTNLTTSDIDEIAISYDKWQHLKGLLKYRWSWFDDYYSMRALFHIRRIMCSNYEFFQYMSDRIILSDLKRIPISSYDHHMSHASSAFCCSGFNESLVLVSDCCGESRCTSLYIGNKDGLKLIKGFDIPNSLGILYSVVTTHLGFNSFQDEYKVMGLASYGQANYINEFSKLIKYDEFGNYKVDRNKIFDLVDILGPARKKGEPILQRHKDIAKSLQMVLEEVLTRLLSYYQRITGIKNLCMAGGTALNCVANGSIYDKKIFDEIYVQPASSDAGTAIGAAALANYRHHGDIKIKCESMYLGTEYSNKEIGLILNKAKVHYVFYEDGELINKVALLLSKGKIGGLFRGRMEAGPRALGNRSVIADPTSRRTLEMVNLIKGREMFRPVAPVVKEDKFSCYFEGALNKYMLFTCHVKDEAKEVLSAVTHVDGTARVQTVTLESNRFLYELLDEFEKVKGVPVLVNTSLNFHGKPIIESPVDAIADFYSSGLDFLVIENYLLEK